MKQMTLQEAINKVLRADGVSPSYVDDIEVLSPSAAAIRTLIEEYTSLNMAEMYPLNWVQRITLSPDSDGFIYTPTTWLSFRVISPGEVNIRNITTRDNKLYNTETQSFVWSSSVDVEAFIEVEFEKLPWLYQQYIVHVVTLDYLVTSRAENMDPATLRLRESLVNRSRSQLLNSNVVYTYSKTASHMKPERPRHPRKNSRYGWWSGY